MNAKARTIDIDEQIWQRVEKIVSEEPGLTRRKIAEAALRNYIRNYDNKKRLKKQNNQ